MKTPGTRYQVSPRLYPATLPEIEYPSGDTIAVVKHNGQAFFRGCKLKVPNSLVHLPIAFRPDSACDGAFDVFFCHHRFMHLDKDGLAVSK